MAAIEFTSNAGKNFTVQLYEGIGENPIGDQFAMTDPDVPGRYRANVTGSGVVYVVATAPNVAFSGYANLSKPGPNGFSELLDTYDDALALGDTPTPPPPGDLQPGDVRAGIAYLDSNGDNQEGTLELPAEDEVLSGVSYGAAGTEFTGTLESIGADAAETNVLPDGSIRDPLWLGTDYNVSYGNGFVWLLPAPAGLDPEDVTGHFRGRKACGSSTEYAWDSEAVSITVVTISGLPYWRLQFNVTDEQTLSMLEGDYYWWVIAETISSTIVLTSYASYRGPVRWRAP
jgi:hypothetical protein